MSTRGAFFVHDDAPQFLGLVSAAETYALASVSGAHFNPAVTLAVVHLEQSSCNFNLGTLGASACGGGHGVQAHRVPRGIRRTRRKRRMRRIGCSFERLRF